MSLSEVYSASRSLYLNLSPCKENYVNVISQKLATSGEHCSQAPCFGGGLASVASCGIVHQLGNASGPDPCLKMPCGSIAGSSCNKCGLGLWLPSSGSFDLAKWCWAGGSRCFTAMLRPGVINLIFPLGQSLGPQRTGEAADCLSLQQKLSCLCLLYVV